MNIIKILLTVYILNIATVGFCMCAGEGLVNERIPVERGYHYADVIFWGKLKNFESYHKPMLDFEVLKQYKGKQKEEIFINFWAAGYEFDPEKTYLIYAYMHEDGLWATPCSRIKDDNNPYMKTELAILDEISSDPNWKYSELKFQHWKNKYFHLKPWSGFFNLMGVLTRHFSGYPTSIFLVLLSLGIYLYKKIISH